MLLTRSRIPILALGLIALFAFVLLFTGKQVDAGDSVGDVTVVAGFEGVLGIGAVPAAAGTEWVWTGQGDQLKMVVFLGAGLTNIAEIEVFVQPTILNTQPVFSQRPTAGGVFPTGTNIAFIGTVPTTRQIGAGDPFVVGGVLPLVPGTTIVGIHLVDVDDNDIVQSATPTAVPVSADITSPASAPPSEDGGGPVIAQPLPTAEAQPTPTPPTTGDLAPGSGLLLPILLVGFLMILAGGVYLARDRRLKS